MVGDEPSSSSAFNVSSLSRVTSSSLDPRKHWYVLTKEVCRGYPKDFARNEIFKSFPNELRSVAPRELQPAKSAYSSDFRRTPNTVYVASTFGLIAGLLRQSGRSASGFLNSAVFTPIVNLLNSIALDMEHRDAMDFAFGGKACPVIEASEELQAELAEKSRSIEFLELKLKNLQGQVVDLETSLSDFSSSEPTCCSTPVNSRSPSSCCSSIEETKCSPDLGSTTRKRQVVAKCKEVLDSISDVSEKYKESIACVLGNSFIYGDDAQRENVRNHISEVINIVMDSKGSKKGFSELLSSETHARVFQSMRVPDWVLLYFKLHTKLPDSAWQTLLNLTQLGKTGVGALLGNDE